MPLVDPSLFFMTLFGSQDLDPWVGKFKLAAALDVVLHEHTKAPMDVDADTLDATSLRTKFSASVEKHQKKREVRLALQLRDRLKTFVEAQDEETKTQWEEKITQEAHKLCESAFCDDIVDSIGWIYQNHADAYLGEVGTLWGMGATLANMQAAGRTVANTWNLAKSFVRATVAVTDIHARQERKRSEALQQQRGSGDNTGASEGGAAFSALSPDAFCADSQQQSSPTACPSQTPTGSTPAAAAANTTDPGHDANPNEGAAAHAARATADSQAETLPHNRAASQQYEGTLPSRLDTHELGRVGEILQSILSLVLYDVEETVRAAADKVCRDESVPLAERIKRAEGLRLIGRGFQAAAAAEKAKKLGKSFDVTHHMEKAFIRAAQKGDEGR
eukprot:GHVT01080104.1.p1 GENE.GHVT01080104.1~~GHVT01080104.1.p1  ORF type:complete len:390 (+),score=83.39 GHVT01080104.1:397-1566(+)